MVKLTVFTPTYNRADLIVRGYRALCRQACHDFKWLIIDDGSIDKTNELVKSWLKEESLELVHGGFQGFSKDAPWLQIRYCYKENGGLHTGYNKAIELMDTEICICIDSDDFASEDMAEFVVDFWEKNKSELIAGIIGLDYKINGGPIAGKLPDVDTSKIIDIRQKHKYMCDTKIVMRVDLLKALKPQPTYNNEKNFNPIYLMLQLDKDRTFKVVNHNLCYVDYQDTGMAANIFKQYVNSPNSFAALRQLYISLPDGKWSYKLRNLLHLTSSAILSKKISWITTCKYPVLGFLMLPIGFILTLYIKRKANY